MHPNLPLKFYVNLLQKALLFMFLSSLLLGCASHENVISDTWQHYSFEASTILAQLADNAGEYNDLFIFEPKSIDISSLERTATKWGEDEFYLVAQAIHHKEWGENLDDWHPRAQLQFYDCTGIEDGPYAVYFTFYKNENGARFVSYIRLDPHVNILRTRHIVYAPRISEWKVMDIDNILSAADALKNAEEAGGEALRRRLNNVCNIQIDYLRPESNTRPYPIWDVSYYPASDDLSAIVRYDVNALTGEVEKVTDIK